MEIDINQNPVQEGERYQIFICAKPTHIANTIIVKSLPEVKLLAIGKFWPKYVVRKRFVKEGLHYRITRFDNVVFEFKSTSSWKLHYCCQAGQNRYDIYGHFGNKYSVYKNDAQIGWWSKKTVNWFKGNNYKMVVNVETDVDLLMAFYLVINSHMAYDKNGKMGGFDYKKIAFPVKKFNASWKPK
ncbi:MAG: hypothetical protein V4717_06210 [Bacteroidota bacterium]